MTLPVLPLLIIGLILLCLFVAIVLIQGSYLNRLAERQGELETWAAIEDPDYWRERLGREDSGPFLNEPPEPDGPPECPGVHPVAADGKTCSDCGIDLILPAEVPQA